MLLGPQRRARRRLLRDLSLAGLGLVSIGLAVCMVIARQTIADVTAASGLFVGIASLSLALLDFLRQEPAPPDPAVYADDLAFKLRDQWLDEAEARRLRDPRVLPLAWSTTSRPVADELRAAGTGARVLRMHLDGRLDGRFDTVIGQLARGYEQLTQGRLVVIGEPGAGKTVLAMLLTLGLLEARQPGGRVPVLLPVSTWDPVREPLDDWIVRTLAVPYYSGRQEIPRTLLTHGLLLPVLDGLDEIPESARRAAIRGINQAIGGERPIVVTCRAVEYEELIRGGAPTLRQAPVVEVTPVPPRDVVAYLREVEWPESAAAGWPGVFARLRAEPDGPLAEALSTPLMVTTARLVYQRGGGDPVELLDRERFDCRYAVEDYLTHRVLDATYGRDPLLPDGADVRDPWDAERARRWLTFLARYLHDHRERDLAWWLMSGRVLPAWAGPVVSFGLGLLLTAGAILWTGVTTGFRGRGVIGSVLVPLCIGGGFALISYLIWYAAGTPQPGRLSFSLRGSAGRLRRGFRLGLVLGTAAVVPVMAGTCVFRVLMQTSGPGSLQAAQVVSESLTVSVAVCLVVGVAVAAHNWLNAPPSYATQAAPGNSHAQDRRSALAGAAVGGLVVGVTGLFGIKVGQLVGYLTFGVLTDWPGLPGTGDLSDTTGVVWRHVDDALGVESYGWGLSFILPGVTFALTVFLTRAWPRFLVARAWLAATGKFPWRFFAFLGDARRREIVKQANSAYQFRHIRLQEALAGEPTYVRGLASTPTGVTGTVRRRLVLGAGVALALGGGAAAIRKQRDEGDVWYWDREKVAMTAVAFHPLTGELVWGAEDGRLWKGPGPEDRKLLLPALSKEDPESATVSRLMFHRSGDFLVLDRGNRLRLMNDLPNPGGRFREWGAYASSYFSFLGDGRFLAVGDDVGISVWEISDGGQLVRIKKVKVREGADWDVLDGGLVFIDGKGRVVRYEAPDFSEHSHATMVRREGGKKLFDTGYFVGSPNGDCLYLEHIDTSRGSLWHFDERARLWRETVPEFVDLNVVFHPRVPLVALTDYGSSQGRLSGGTIELWRTGRTPRRWQTLRGHMGTVKSMSFNASGTRLASASEDGTVRVWKVSPWTAPSRDIRDL